MSVGALEEGSEHRRESVKEPPLCLRYVPSPRESGPLVSLPQLMS